MFKKTKKPIESEFEDLEDKDLQELYEKGADYIERALNTTHDCIVALLDGDDEEFQILKKKNLKIEGKSDDVHDHIVQRLYGGEVLVFSRTDRLYIINQMDDIVDRSEDIILAASAYRPRQIKNPLAIRIVAVINNLKVIGTLLKDAVTTIFKDFNATIPIVKNIEKLKSEAHRDYQEFFEKMFDIEGLSAKELTYYERLIEAIWKAIFVANKFADGLRGLIFKYRL